MATLKAKLTNSPRTGLALLVPPNSRTFSGTSAASHLCRYFHRLVEEVVDSYVVIFGDKTVKMQPKASGRLLAAYTAISTKYIY